MFLSVFSSKLNTLYYHNVKVSHKIPNLRVRKKLVKFEKNKGMVGRRLEVTALGELLVKKV